MSQEEEAKILERHAAQLSEHFESVRIIATTQRDGTTSLFSSGAGNFYAQTGSVREWLARQDEHTLENVRQAQSPE